MSIYRCKKSFMANVDGKVRSVRLGDLVDGRDSVVKGRERFFDTVEEHVAKHAQPEPVVERATAEPGEKRSVGRPRKAPKADELTPENAPKTAAEAAAAGVTLDESK